MIEYLVLIFSIPLGILFSRITNWEREIYMKPHYFPTIAWILAILTAIFLSLDKVIGMSLLFSFLTVIAWWKEKKISNFFKKNNKGSGKTFRILLFISFSKMFFFLLPL